MNGGNTWSYAPYRPFLTEVGDLYICRVAPSPNAIRFEWLSFGETASVFYKKRSDSDFLHWTDTSDGFCDIDGLEEGETYEFYVSSSRGRSRVRFARCGESVGTVVNYLHPEDEAYAFSGRYLCSPSLLRHPDGYLLASMDVFAGQHPQNLTLIFRSDDDGKTWYYLTELMPCFWGKLFLHKGEVYMLSVNTEYGDLLIGKSCDGGKTFGTPTILLRGSNGKNGNAGVHKNPQNLLVHNGRIYTSLEWGSWRNKVYGHAAMVMSCCADDDLLVAENWAFTPPVPFDNSQPGCEGMKQDTMTIEGTVVAAPDGKLLNVMRFGKRGYVLAYEINTEDPHAPLTFCKLLSMPTSYSKFMIKFDDVSGRYYSVICRLHEGCGDNARNLLSLVSSEDLEHWQVVADLIDRRGRDEKAEGFQYVDFFFEGDDLLFLCRTAMNRAANFHDSNYSTFHRVSGFRKRSSDRE